MPLGLYLVLVDLLAVLLPLEQLAHRVRHSPVQKLAYFGHRASAQCHAFVRPDGTRSRAEKSDRRYHLVLRPDDASWAVGFAGGTGRQTAAYEPFDSARGDDGKVIRAQSKRLFYPTPAVAECKRLVTSSIKVRRAGFEKREKATL